MAFDMLASEFACLVHEKLCVCDEGVSLSGRQAPDFVRNITDNDRARASACLASM